MRVSRPRRQCFGRRQRAHRFRPVRVEEDRQRVMAVGLLPGRGCVFLVGVRDHEDAVEIDDDLTVGVRGILADQRPGTTVDFGACGPDGLRAFSPEAAA